MLNTRLTHALHGLDRVLIHSCPLLDRAIHQRAHNRIRPAAPLKTAGAPAKCARKRPWQARFPIHSTPYPTLVFIFWTRIVSHS